MIVHELIQKSGIKAHELREGDTIFIPVMEGLEWKIARLRVQRCYVKAVKWFMGLTYRPQLRTWADGVDRV